MRKHIHKQVYYGNWVIIHIKLILLHYYILHGFFSFSDNVAVYREKKRNNVP